MKKKFILSILFLLMFLPVIGCTTDSIKGQNTEGVQSTVGSVQSETETQSKTDSVQSKYSFENPEIVAYVKGVPVYKVDMNNFIIMKKTYMQAFAKLDGDNISDAVPLQEKIIIQWEIKQAKSIITYNEEDWKEDYYKSIILAGKYHDVIKSKSNINIDQNIAGTADAEVQAVLDESKNESETSDPNIVIVEDVSSVDVVPVIQSVADDLGISFEECANTVYKPFWITDFEYNYLLFTSFSELSYGEKVEDNGTNATEYESYISNFMDTNKKYLDTLLENAEIIERP